VFQKVVLGPLGWARFGTGWPFWAGVLFFPGFSGGPKGQKNQFGGRVTGGKVGWVKFVNNFLAGAGDFPGLRG